jgi:hypothetical protein
MLRPMLTLKWRFPRDFSDFPAVFATRRLAEMTPGNARKCPHTGVMTPAIRLLRQAPMAVEGH